jgi:antibiotic biosynthesis monooxygenase (ABM) superfamily enzyme
MNMLVLMMLYPVVFLFGAWFQGPLLSARGVPFWLALFIGNVASVVLLSRLVPWVSRRFDWWLAPRGTATLRTNLLGAGVVIGVYVVSLLIFAAYSRVLLKP